MNAQDILDIVRQPRPAGVPGDDPRFGRFMEDGTPRLSPSQINLLLTCPGRWKRHYLDGLPDPPGVDAIVGTVLHAAMEVALGRLKDSDLVGMQEIQTATTDALAMHLRDPMVSATLRDAPRDIDGLCDGARYAIRTAWDWVSTTQFQPDGIEQAIDTRLDVDGTAVGIAMVTDATGTIDGRRVVVDWKFPRRNPTNYGGTIYARPGYVLATTYYDIALREQGFQADDLLIAHFGRGEIRPAIASYDASEARRQQAIHVAKGAVRLVLAGELPDNPVAAGALCSHKFCGYWTICPGGGGPA